MHKIYTIIYNFYLIFITNDVYTNISFLVLVIVIITNLLLGKILLFLNLKLH